MRNAVSVRSGEAGSYEQRYTELVSSQPQLNAMAQVTGLVVGRDAARFTFESGNFHLLTPVSGRVVGAVFLGKGIFAFTPTDPIEQERLERFHRSRS